VRLDREFAVSGSPLIDVGHFLRYKCASRRLSSRMFRKDNFLTMLSQNWSSSSVPRLKIAIRNSIQGTKANCRMVANGKLSEAGSLD